MSLMFLCESDIDDTDSDPDYVQPNETNSKKNDRPMVRSTNLSNSTLRFQPGPSTSDLDTDFQPSLSPSYLNRPTGTQHGFSTSNTSVVVSLPETPQNKGRKRVKNTSQWKRNITKKQRASGSEYVNKSGTLVHARSTGPDCKCKSHCFLKIPDNLKCTIINNFNEIADKEKQDIMLSGLISLCQIDRRRPKTGDGQPRAYSCRYKIKVGKFEEYICKKAFCSLHGVGKARVERIIKHLQDESATPKDNRGRHHNRPNKIPQEAVQNIDKHIQSFPSRTSHYSRNKNQNVRYLSPDLNLSKMYKLYLKMYENQISERQDNGEECKPIVSYDFYCRHFNSNYKLFFGAPRSDTCQTCDRLENLIKSEQNQDVKQKIICEKAIHLRKSEEFYKDLKSRQIQAKENEDIEVISFDYQQNMPLPVIPSGDVFYKRQLWVYNFTICSTKTGKSYCHMYDETTGKKGQNEVISILNHFIKNEVNEKVKRLFIFSDNCSAQNKNHTLVQYLYTLAKGLNRFDEIHHRYPEPGHSFLPCDRTFGVIEKERRKRERLYLPEDYYGMVQQSSKKCIVIKVTQDMFLDFNTHFSTNGFIKPSKLYSKVGKTGRTKKASGGVKFTISKYRHLVYNKKELLCSISSSSLLQDSFVLEANNASLSLPDPDAKLYQGQLFLNPKKLNDVLNLCQKYVPPDCMWYYNNLTAEVTIRQENDEEDSDSDD